MTDSLLVSRKSENEDRRRVLSDSIKVANAELQWLVNAYDDILKEEDKLHDDEGLVKLLNVPSHTWISLTKDPTTLIYFDHPDGMYSFCVSPLGQLTHISLYARVYVHPELDLEAPVFPVATPGEFRTT